jgi:hypothetical protein|tara:strand:+ start:7529 stop:9037 length:1509 start_codon:yes stop_codon:yes gene_type:complete
MAGKIRNTNLNNSVVTAQSSLSQGNVATDDQVLVFDTSGSTFKKTNSSNIGIQPPSVSAITPTSVARGDGTGNVTFTITGTGFNTGTTAKLITNGGANVAFSSVTIDSLTQLTAVCARSNFLNANEPYDISVTNGTGLTVILANQVNVDGAPTFVTASGSLGSTRGGGDFIIEAFDPESGSDPGFELKSGSFPPGMSITNVDSGRCTVGGTISPTPTSDTTYNFVIRAFDAASNESTRAFSITANGPSYTSFTSDGTFSVPSGLTAVDVLVVAGGGGSNGLTGPQINNPDHQGNNGGGGAGGLIFMPGFPVTPGGTVAVTVGQGGPNGSSGQDSVFGTLTADGGGNGKVGFYIIGYQPGTPGGSGGGGGRGRDSGGPAGTGQQPSQPGNSGAYGFGQPGGSQGGGGGGAQQPGGNGTSGKGGDGRAYTIADGTTSVIYAGGGGGVSGVGGDGGGGPNPAPTVPNPKDGLANRGGGGRGGTQSSGPEFGPRSSGGSGIVIVKT